MENLISSSALSKNRRKIIEIRANKKLFNLDLDSVWQYRELFYFLLLRDLKVRYKQTAIGTGWAVIQPILSVLIFTLVFGYFARIPSDGVPYAVFAFTGVLPWTLFAESLRRGSFSLVGDSELIRKIYFPRLIIVLTTISTPLVDFIVSFVVLLILLAWYGIVPTINVVFLPLCVVFLIITALALSLWLGPLNVCFRDIQHIIPFLLQIWMYASPVVYPISIVPEKWRWLYSLNPMVGVIEMFRWALLRKDNPDFQSMAIGGFFVAFLLLSGLVYFKKMERAFADMI